ncbi:CheR family methyltransferase [Achromobacter ruhlandii]|nr:CheR family methyltransferase [Achromobacter ruhlandii]MCZ8436186.1 methyltransferase [Achromobacter ruhlandii]MDC6088346.1 methyltransferase [Achromobacter ruhlandii]MDC6154144.1 methyltransferase [Achromobacter ruhlandii]MDD7983188.1 methyltransferase [Achromobacter ruhlandii]WIW05884.1 CheR family methyltransferase [Achromobacter ruhlandii]
MIHARAGISLGAHKREMVYSRLARRLRALGRQDFGSYLDQLENEPDAAEWEDFVNALTTNLTAFFRESHHFPILADFAQKRGGPVSVWCCAASTGEEPYSIAITLAEALGPRAGACSVLATDIDTNVLNRARTAVYPAERVAKMEESRLKRFFLKGRGANAGQVRVRPEIADMVRYETLNLLAPSWPISEKFDVIFCRNVMIYFDKPTQAKILERFVPLLKPGGLLFAGHSENFTYISRDFRLRGQTVYECAGKA